VGARWATFPNEQARCEETVTDKWASCPVISKRKINSEIEFHRGKIARVEKNSWKICAGRRCNLE
jgi:hypothetical protein